MKIWYTKPAAEWTEALPMGNGHMGIMAFGGEKGEFILTENTCWSGGTQEHYLKEDAGVKMKKARGLLMQRKFSEADALLADCAGIKENYGTQVPMGIAKTELLEACISQTRSLELFTGICTDELFLEDGRKVTRTSFVSNPDRVFAIRLEVSNGNLPETELWIDGYSQPSHAYFRDNHILAEGRALENIHSDGLHGVKYNMEAAILSDGTLDWRRHGMLLTGASFCEIYLCAATDMFHQNPAGICHDQLAAAVAKGWDTLFHAHIQEQESWMKKCTLNLPENQWSGLPTDERMAKYREDPSDQALEALMFQYGRYLILGTSRPDSLLPAALQGVWNDNRACRMEWTDDMHLDINTQMNYYPAENTGLSACSEPLFSWIRNILMPEGEKIAKELYGCDGWCAHTISNAFGWAAPGFDSTWGMHVSGGGWIASHIWEHYLYTKDLDFLKENYHVLYGSAQFLYGLLMEEPKNGKLLTVPSFSPENTFGYEGQYHNLCVAATMDVNVTKYIFDAVAKAADLLNDDRPFIQTIIHARQKLPDFKVGKNGQLQEWYDDFEEVAPGHRHTSHLLALHPFNLIDPEKDPELKAAIIKSLDMRMEAGGADLFLTNWAGGLIILYYARLLDGENAAGYIRPMIGKLARPNLLVTHIGEVNSMIGGIYELDGNTGLTAGIAEMLLQSYTGEIRVLPAIPASWESGSYTGLRAYGGHIVDVSWDKSRTEVTVHSAADEELTIICGEKRTVVSAQKDQNISLIF